MNRPSHVGSNVNPGESGRTGHMAFNASSLILSRERRVRLRLRADIVRTRLHISEAWQPVKGCTGNFSHVQISIMKPSGSWKKIWSISMPPSLIVSLMYLMPWSRSACSTCTTESLCRKHHRSLGRLSTPQPHFQVTTPTLERTKIHNAKWLVNDFQ